jgi:hypothetical protein
MVRVVPGERHSYLVAERPEELRRFLRARGIRPTRAGFNHILPPPCIRLSCYRLAGDEHLAILGLGLPQVTWGQLALSLLLPGRRPVYQGAAHAR